MRMILFSLIVIVHAMNTMGCSFFPCKEHCTSVWLRTTKKDVVTEKCTSEGQIVQMYVDSCSEEVGRSIKGSCASESYLGVVRCTGRGRCAVHRTIETTGLLCDCPGTCSPYTKPKVCRKGYCYDAGDCQCKKGNPLVRCLADPCMPVNGVNRCANGYKCVANYCGGCNFTCKKLLTLPNPKFTIGQN